VSVVGIVPAGGSGERLGADRPKAFVVCAGRPLIEWSLEVLEAVCDRVVVAAPADWLRPGWVEGGPSRSASVRNALAAAPEARTAVVHDAARPLVTRELVEACVGALMGVDGAIAAAPVTDTVKEAGPDRLVTATLDRTRLWAIQTPQAFRRPVLERALGAPDEVLDQATDDAWLVERTGGSVRVVESTPANFKVTTPHDLRLADHLLADRLPRSSAH
jgi:2-C-methyl-D-erythritol 4-phosphate cytidylyltransferase